MSREKIINGLTTVAIFLSAISLFKSPFEFYGYYLIFFVLLPFITDVIHLINRKLLLLFAGLIAVGIVNIILGNNSAGQFIKVFFGVSLSIIFYYNYLKYNSFDVKKVFHWYMKGAVVVAGIGAFQYASYKVGFTYGYDYTWILNRARAVAGAGRLTSILPEPAHYAQVMGPAMFVSFYNLLSFQRPVFIKKWQSVLILVTYVLTFSSTGILGMFFALGLLSFNLIKKRYLVIVGAVGAIAVSTIYTNNFDFRLRVNSVLTLTVSEEEDGYIDLSTFALYSNWVVATENLKEHPLFGTGLGSHSTAYDKYRPKGGIFDYFERYELNKHDANSLTLRLLSETGLVGFGFMMFIIFRFYVFKKEDEPPFDWIISNSILVMMQIFLLRQGHYFLNGFPLFIWLYYYNWKNRKLRKATLAEAKMLNKP